MIERPFVAVAKVADLPPGAARQVTVADRWVGLFNVDGTFHAIDNLCLHRGGPLADGVVKDCIVTCPWHHWQYDLTSGTLVQDPRVGVTRHETRIVGEEVQVRLADERCFRTS